MTVSFNADTNQRLYQLMLQQVRSGRATHCDNLLDVYIPLIQFNSNTNKQTNKETSKISVDSSSYSMTHKLISRLEL